MPPDDAPAAAAANPVQPPGPLRGSLDHVTATRVAGWAYDPARPDAPVELELLDNGAPVTRFLASHHRDDLAAAGIGRGHCAFRLAIPAGWNGLASHVLRVRRVCDGAELPGSPVTIAPPAPFDARLAAELAASLRALADEGSEPEVAAATQALVRQIDRLLRARAVAEDAPARTDIAAFYARWGGLLDDPLPPVPRRPPERPPAIRRRAVLVAAAPADALAPSPGAILRGLERLDHQITVVAAESCLAGEARAALAAAGRSCIGPPFVASAEEALRLLAGLCDVAVLYGAPQALRYAALLRHHCPRARLLLCLDALASRGLAQRASAEQRPDLQALAARVHTQEAVAAWSVDAVLARSHNDAARLRGMVAGLDVHVIGGGEDAAVDAALHAVLRLPQERARAAAGE